MAWGVYPSTGGSTIILNNIALGFDRSELVIAGQAPKQMPDKKWESFSDIPFYYLDPFPFNIRRPERYVRWLAIGKVSRQVEQIIKKEKITHILSIFPDEYYAYIGYRLSKKLRLPFYFWLHNSYLENRTGALRWLATKLQPRLFAHAQKVFVMSDGLNRDMSKNNPSVKFETLVHGFDLKRPASIETVSKDKKIKFLYSGSLNDSCLDASVRMLKVVMKGQNNEIHIYSGNSQVFRDQGIDGDQITFHDFLPLQDFVGLLYKYDIMLLPHGIDGERSDFEYRTIFPTRTIPLLFSGKPILAHSPKDSFLTEFLVDSDCAYVVTDKSEKKIEEGIEKIITDEVYVDKIVQNAFIASKRFELKGVIENLKSYL
jgi:glycosyltransferase involved in cell wall biosynthesis